MSTKTHITTRRGFVAATGFGGIALYGLWAAYGAAPGPLALLGLDAKHDAGNQHPDGAGHQAEGHQATAGSEGGGHGGHGGAVEGPSPDEFSRLTAEFIERFRLPDGSVHPRRLAAAPQPAHDDHAGHADDHASAGHQADPAHAHASAGHPAGQQQQHANHAAPAADGAPIDVLMAAGKFYYLPNALRLDAGQPYRFRMMALDASHGASIQFGQGGRMMRLRPGRLTESEMTFHQPGRYLMICTVYCGAAHDMMQASIEVV